MKNYPTSAAIDGKAPQAATAVPSSDRPRRVRNATWVLVWGWAAWIVAAVPAAEPLVELQRGADGTARFVVRPAPPGVPTEPADADHDRWQQVLAVYTIQDGQRAPVPLLGDYSRTQDAIQFTPRYPLRAGVTYRAVVRAATVSDASGKPLERDFPVERPAAPATRLTAIYPTADVVPENLLKLYLQFSSPMSRGEAYRRLRLREVDGEPVEKPFLELSEELWSPDGTRLTVYFEPGRIKRGLQPRELFGPVLMEGKEYLLEIDAGWPDATGRPLARQGSILKKIFRAAAPDDRQPAAAAWQLEAPPAGTREPLVVQFEEPLDAAMLVRVVRVQDDRGRPVVGQIELGAGERSWQFRPAEPWRAGKYTLTAASELEDLAGNSLGRPFEVDVFRPLPAVSDARPAQREFRVEPAG